MRKISNPFFSSLLVDRRDRLVPTIDLFDDLSGSAVQTKGLGLHYVSAR